MSVHRALFSSVRDDWETPPELFRLLDREFNFELDVCATPMNRKCPRYLSPARNGLRARWKGTCWMNPPYGREIGVWVRKARQEAERGAIVVCLLPARTDTAWWQDHVMKAREIRLLRGRLTFDGARWPAPFPSAVAIFKKSRKQPVAPRFVTWDWQRVRKARTGIGGLRATVSSLRTA